MLGKYKIAPHAIKRYEERTNKTNQSITRRMLRDLNALRSKRLVYIGDTIHMFYTTPSNNVREFIIKKRGEIYLVTTVINRSREDSDLAYKNRLRQKREYENNK